MNDQARNDDQPAEARARTSPWEWVAGAIGAVLVAACIGYLGWQAATSRGAPQVVDPRLHVTSVERAGGGLFHVRVHAYNAGAAPAAALKVSGQLLEGGRVVEEAQTEFQFLPAHSGREAVLFFRRDPRGMELLVTARSHQAP